MNLTKWEILIVILVLMISAFAIASYGQTVSHSAGQILPGTFAAGLYHFVNNLNVSDTLFVDGDLNITGTVYNPSNLYMIVGNLISLVSSGNIELNATSGQIDLNSDEVYINHTRVINYTDDSAPLEIYSGNSTPIACPTGFGLAYYGWAFAGIGRHYEDTTNAVLGGELSCFQNDSLINNSMWQEGALPSPNVGWAAGGSACIWWLVNNSGTTNNITACTVCYPNGGEHVRVYTTDYTGSASATCPSDFQKLFSTDGYVYVGGGVMNATGAAIFVLPSGTSALTGGDSTCVANMADWISTVDTSVSGSGELPAYYHSSGGNEQYSRCNICYRPSIIK